MAHSWYRVRDVCRWLLVPVAPSERFPFEVERIIFGVACCVQLCATLLQLARLRLHPNSSEIAPVRRHFIWLMFAMSVLNLGRVIDPSAGLGLLPVHWTCFWHDQITCLSLDGLLSFLFSVVGAVLAQ